MRVISRGVLSLGLAAVFAASVGPATAAAASWPAPTPILNDTSIQDLGFAAGGDGEAAMVWTVGPPDDFDDEFRGPKEPRRQKQPKERYRPVFVAATASPPSFGDAQQLGEGRDVRIGMAGDGSALVVWRVGTRLFESVRPSSGSFGPATPIPIRGKPEYAFDMGANGVAAIAWWTKLKGGKRKGANHKRAKPKQRFRLMAAVRHPGTGFGPARRVASAPSTRWTGDLRVEVSDTGGVLLVWSGKRVKAAIGDANGSFAGPWRVPRSRFASAGFSSALAPDGTAMILLNGVLKFDGEVVRASVRPPGGRFGSPTWIGGRLRAFGEVAADGTGAFLVTQSVYLANGRPHGSEVLSYRGGTWSAPNLLFPNLATQSGPPAPSASGAAVIGGSDFGSPDTFILASYRPPGGAFEPPETISTGIPCDCLGTPLTDIDHAGNAWVLWGQGGQLLAVYRDAP